MIMLPLLLACARAGEADPASAAIRADIALDASGLPDCAGSVDDDALCDGFGTENPGTEPPDGTYVPEWMWDPVYPRGLWFAAQLRSDVVEARCAGSAEEANSIFEDEVDGDADYFEGDVDARDARWFDVVFDRTAVAFKIFRVPRCDAFVRFAVVGNLLPGTPAAPHRIDPIWQVATLPPDRVEFFELARTIEVFREGSGSIGQSDWSGAFAVGSVVETSHWTMRTCRIDGRGVWAEGGGVRLGVWQSDYVMDVATGSASFTGSVVRELTCPDPLTQMPEW